MFLDFLNSNFFPKITSSILAPSKGYTGNKLNIVRPQFIYILVSIHLKEKYSNSVAFYLMLSIIISEHMNICSYVLKRILY